MSILTKLDALIVAAKPPADVLEPWLREIVDGIKAIIQQFQFEPADAFTRYQIGRLINVRYYLECNWDWSETGRPQLRVTGANLPNTTLFYTV